MSINNSKIRQIKDIGKVITGRTPPTEITTYFGDEYPFITPTDMMGEKSIRKTERKLSSSGASLLSHNLLPPKSILVSCIGWQMGKVALTVYPSFTNQQINAIILNTNVDVNFIYYSVCTRRKELQNLASVGTRTPILNKSNFENFEIAIPPLPIQHKIADILSAYDDLIENNARRIAILEEMARMLYHEWFVKFHFPGHGQVEMVDSALGPIPEGWKLVSLKDVCTMINRGISPKYDGTSENLVINQRCIRDGHLGLEQARQHSTNFSSEKLVKFGDILINSTGVGTLGRATQVYQPIENCTVDSHVTIVRPKGDINLDYFGLQLLGLQSTFEQLGVGSTGQTELGRESLAKTPFLLPPKELQEEFSSYVSSMRNNTTLLFQRNTNLRHTRDLLLPKLISGEIDVSSWVEGSDVEQGEQEPVPVHAGHVQQAARGSGPDVGQVRPIDVKNLVRHSLWEE